VLEVVVAIVGCQQTGFVFPEGFLTIHQFGNTITEGVAIVGDGKLWIVGLETNSPNSSSISAKQRSI
jgi:hypothetical protein